jgi:hypothetical protein
MENRKATCCTADKFGNRRLSPIREIFPNPISLRLISTSKETNFENRTKRVESRGLEKKGLSKNIAAILEVSSP